MLTMVRRRYGWRDDWRMFKNICRKTERFNMGFKKVKGNSILCINSEKENCNYIYLFDVDYKKIFNWILTQNMRWNKENLKGEINKKILFV